MKMGIDYGQGWKTSILSVGFTEVKCGTLGGVRFLLRVLD